MTNWFIAKWLREAGHRTTLCLLRKPKQFRPAVTEDLAHLSELGVHLEWLPIPPAGKYSAGANPVLKKFQKARRLMFPNLADFYPVLNIKEELERKLRQLAPDGICAYDLGTVLALQGLNEFPRMGILDTQFPYVLRHPRRILPPRLSRDYMFSLFTYPLVMRFNPSVYKSVLKDYDFVGYIGAQHANWLQAKGIDCKYLRPAMIDYGGSKWRESRSYGPVQRKPRLFAFGRYLSYGGGNGLRTLVNQILPVLEKALGENGFELTIAQGAFLQDEDRRLLQRPSVKLLGFIEDIGSALLASDAFLVPLNYAQGARSGIMAAFACGAPVVVQSSSLLGLPELVHGENALVAEDGKGLAEALLRVLGDRELARRLGENGRLTYEKDFSPQAVGAYIVSEMERIAQKNSPVQVQRSR